MNKKIIVSVLLLAVGLYGLTLLATPYLSTVLPNSSFGPGEVEALNITIDEDRVIIPKIGVNLEYRTGGEEILNDYAWYRFPERGNPADGGNFILSAHRFDLGLTPSETRRKSPFFHINKLDVGDDILIHYRGQAYNYQIVERKAASQFDQTIEAVEDGVDKLTLYSCGLGGSGDLREIVTAVLR